VPPTENYRGLDLSVSFWKWKRIPWIFIPFYFSVGVGLSAISFFASSSKKDKIQSRKQMLGF